jgi:putative RNA 2'-phosphotransferase
LNLDLGLEVKLPPEILYHGTATKNLEIIFKEGLKKMKRHHVHMSENIETARKVGSRYGKPVILKVKASEMAAAGFEFFQSENGVWLTDQVPVSFIES